jgi:hypothetical protein
MAILTAEHYRPPEASSEPRVVRLTAALADRITVLSIPNARFWADSHA